MNDIFKTVLYDRHLELKAQMAPFGGWDMPIQYSSGIMTEHIMTRTRAGLFDVSHMGRIRFKGSKAVAFLQHVLTNNAEALDTGESQYTLIQDEKGAALDDAYLYRFVPDEYLLVVNAANREKDLAHFKKHLKKFPDVVMTDLTFETAMISLQGPDSRKIIKKILSRGHLPEPSRNSLSVIRTGNADILVGRTGYTGEPLGFELFMDNTHAAVIWKMLLKNGASPVGLGARDTLRLEAGLPLYGHELGKDVNGLDIPVFASKLSRFAVSFSPLKKDFIGKAALFKQASDVKHILEHQFSLVRHLPKMIMPVAVIEKGIARQGYRIFKDDRLVGHITSGTMIPYKEPDSSGMAGSFKEGAKRRAIALALLNSDIIEGDILGIELRNKRCKGVVVPYHMSSEAPPFVRSIPHDQLKAMSGKPGSDACLETAKILIKKAVENHQWRQTQCINLIPSEMSQSRFTRLLSISDPVNRYAEHKQIKAFSGEDVFYYQGTGFISEVEEKLNREFQRFFGCRNIESRTVSGQMANTAFFSAMVDFINRADRKSEQRRIRKIMNNHIIKGGHLSAQPMGALRDFVARDLKTEKPAVVNFPVLPDNPYKIDVNACEQLIKEHQPELVILGKSMMIHKEPVKELRAMVEEFAPDCLIMYDMAHVLGLHGPYFQEPLKEGAHVITGSTHKTFFGTQRGVIASDFEEDEVTYDLWEAVQRRTFPGSVSNHHLGTMTGLLMAAMEMNCFKKDYQKAVLSNARAFAAALKLAGLDVAGDPAVSFTQTHQVIVNVGYGKGAEAALKLEENNIIVNYQATPVEEGFTASGALRMGVSEMTRFGMDHKAFETLAGLIADVMNGASSVKDQVIRLRKDFRTMQFCFDEKDLEQAAPAFMDILK